MNNNLKKNKLNNSGRKTKHKYLLNELIRCQHCGNKYVGKRNVQNKDNTYKCKGRREKQSCKVGRGINITKLDSFMINYLFHNDKLKELLLVAPKKESELESLRGKLLTKEKEYEECNTSLQKCRELMVDASTKNDSFFKTRYEDLNAQSSSLDDEIESLKKSILDIENNAPQRIAKNTIESYTNTIEFDVLKKSIHELIKEIEIESLERWSKDLEKDFKLFKINITFINSLRITCYADRTATQWFWQASDEPNSKAKRAHKDEWGVHSKDIYEDINGHTIYTGTFNDVDLENDMLIDFNQKSS